MVLSRTVGASITRREDPRLVTGQGQYVDDVRLPGMLYLAAVRSPHAHAAIRHVDTSAALAQPGVVDVAFAEAARVVKLDIFNQRVNSLPMEPRAALAEYRRYDETLTLWSSNQVPHTLRSEVAGLLGLPESRVRVIAPDVGGGFGS